MCHAYYNGPAFGVSGFRLEMGFINVVENHEFFDMGFQYIRWFLELAIAPLF